MVSKYVEGCATCQQNKVNTHLMTPPLNPIAALTNAHPFKQVLMDFITGLPNSYSFDAVLVLVDHRLTKGVVFIPCNKTTDAPKTAQLYQDHVY